MAQSLLFLPTTTILLILSLSSSPTTADDVVLDIYRDPVEAGWDYYIRPVEAYGGGIQLHARAHAPDCPQFVGLDLRSLEYGDPIELLPVSPNVTRDDFYVHLSEELNIATYTDSHKKCPNDVWMVRPDRTNRVIDVVTGGTVTSDSLFRVEKAEFGDNVYVIKHCPAISDNTKFDEDDCGTLGSYYDNIEGKFYLHSTTVSEPLRFYFIKASGRKKLTDVASEPTSSAVQSE